MSQYSGGYFGKEFAGRGVAHADFDNDGDIDIAVGHLDRPLALLSNETNGKFHSISIQLHDFQRRDLTGSTVQIQLDDREITVPVVKGEGYLSSVDPRIIVGVRFG